MLQTGDVQAVFFAPEATGGLTGMAARLRLSSSGDVHPQGQAIRRKEQFLLTALPVLSERVAKNYGQLLFWSVRGGCAASSSYIPKGWGLGDLPVTRRGKVIVLASAVTLLLLLIVLNLMGTYRYELGAVIGWIKSGGPLPFFAAMALLPLIGIPITPFYFAAGAVFEPVVSLPGVVVSLGVNHLLAYALGRKTLRPVLELVMRRRRLTLPEPGSRDSLYTALVIKLTPGLPFFLRSYLMAVAGIPLRIYLLVTWPLSMAYAVPAILLGESLVEGRGEVAGIALMILLAVGVLTYFLRVRILKKKTPSADLQVWKEE